MTDKNSFLLYDKHYTKIEKLNYEQKGKLLDAIFQYHISDKLPVIDDVAVDIVFTLMREDIDYNDERYAKQCEINATNGKKGGRPHKPNETENNPSVITETERKRNKPTKSLNDNEYDNDIDISNNKLPASTRPADEPKYDEAGNEYRLSNLLYTEILKNDSKFKKPNMQKWALHMDRLIRIDKREPGEVQEVVLFCQRDSFWCANIQSTETLREKYSKLLLKMKEKPKGKNANDTILHHTYTEDEYEAMMTKFEDA